MQIKISVVMLTYNRSNLVSYMIEDILGQTFKDFEYIIVNNGSTDNTADILAAYAKRDERIKIITLDGKATADIVANSIGRARNIGMNAANGEFLAFVDDDDRVEPDFLEFLYDLAIKNDADISMCGASEGNGDLTKRSPQCLFDEKMIVSGEKAVELMLGRKYIRANAPTKLYKTEILRKHPFVENYKNEDVHTQYRYLLEAKKVALWGIDKYYFVSHAGNISGFIRDNSMWNEKTMHDYLFAYRTRTDYIREKAPSLYKKSVYAEWSFMISMINKIISSPLLGCDNIRDEFVRNLFENSEEFMNMPETTEQEKNWMKEYVL